ncbi:MAG: hypothetical protein LC644_05190, partial [Pseudonocardia sp.]|nr:hypothetical protein [Pseudonocardia sp.]
MPDWWRANARKLLGEYSARTFSRQWTASRLLQDISREIGKDVTRPAPSAAIRPNGSVNSSKLERLAHVELIAI